MSDNKAKALKDDIKVEVIVNDCLNGNDATTVDITNLLNFDNAVIIETPSGVPEFGGIVGYKVSHKNTGYTLKLFTEYDLDNLGKKIARILQASIVNAKQLEALNGMLTDTIYQMKMDKSLHISRISPNKS